MTIYKAVTIWRDFSIVIKTFDNIEQAEEYELDRKAAGNFDSISIGSVDGPEYMIIYFPKRAVPLPPQKKVRAWILDNTKIGDTFTASDIARPLGLNPGSTANILVRGCRDYRLVVVGMIRHNRHDINLFKRGE